MTSISRQSSFKSISLSSASGSLSTSNKSTQVGELRTWMEQCRQSTLQLFEGIDHDRFCQQAHPDFSPIGWHLGHIAYTEALWILEHLAGRSPLFPEYRKLFAADTLPKRDRVHLPAFAEVKTYLDTIREQVFIYLNTAPFEQQERLWRWLLQHESQHYETIAIVLALQEQALSSSAEMAFNSTSTVSAEMIYIPAGTFKMGYDGIDAIDNEQPGHSVHLDAYWIDAAPVTCGQYQQFIQAGGYENAQWWSAEGWNWRHMNQVTQPLYWMSDSSKAEHPVCGVSWYEAEAYANFVGKRLPTEAEWEKAARLSAADNWLGAVWEWTDSWFDGYPGFAAYPYRGYSQVYFDRQHRVLRGGSWATRPWALRATFRNWYHPYVREIFSGFRCARNKN